MNKLLSRLSVGVMKASKSWAPKQGPVSDDKTIRGVGERFGKGRGGDKVNS